MLDRSCVRGRVNSALAQLEERAANLTPYRARSGGFHPGQNRGGGRIGDSSERARECNLADARANLGDLL